MKSNYSHWESWELLWNEGRYIPYMPPAETDEDKAEVERTVLDGMAELAVIRLTDGGHLYTVEEGPKSRRVQYVQLG
jgi:hypothetical protein